MLFNLLLSPCDVLRSRLMATTSGNVRDAARAVLAQHGPSGFFRGLMVTTLKAFPVNAGGFAALHYAKLWLGVDN